MTAGATIPATTSLAGMLGRRRWIRRVTPFPHIVAYDVFEPPIYARLEQSFHQILDGIAQQGYLEGHDIYGTTIGASLAPMLEPLSSRAWHDLLARITGVQATGHVALGLHHHTVGSADGFPHNDLNPGWFADDPPPGAIELSDPSVVEYTTGVAHVASVRPREVVRAVAALFYLSNGNWEPGDGGTTGMYRGAADDPNRPVLVVPPLDNSLLVFECTPVSWHGFIGNRRRPRNSMIMWLHRPKADVVARWGESAIVPYGRR